MPNANVQPYSFAAFAAWSGNIDAAKRVEEMQHSLSCGAMRDECFLFYLLEFGEHSGACMHSVPERYIYDISSTQWIIINKSVRFFSIIFDSVCAVCIRKTILTSK